MTQKQVTAHPSRGAEKGGGSGAKALLWKLGPGLITGAADDDPSGIATYSQVGAQFGYGMLWTMLFSFPLMAAIQEISARIGRVSGIGIAGNLRRHYPKPFLYGIVSLLLIANIFNIGADIGAMGAAAGHRGLGCLPGLQGGTLHHGHRACGGRRLPGRLKAHG